MVPLCQVTQLPYPIKAKPLGKFRYFQKVRRIFLLLPKPIETSSRNFCSQREEWKVTDVLFNPMLMMMVMPLLLITVLPKMMQVMTIDHLENRSVLNQVLSKDPETKKEMEEMQAKMNVQNVPEMSEMITNLFGGGAPAPKKKAGGGASSTVRARRQ